MSAIWISWLQENAFQTHFLTSKHTLSIADKHHFPCKYYGLVIKYTKSHNPNWCIKVGNTPASLPCWWVVLIFFCNQVWQGQSVMFRLKLLLLKITLQPPFYGIFMMGFNFLKATEPLRRDTFYHSTPRTSSYSFSQPQKHKRLSDLGHFQIQDPYITNTAP